MIQPTPSNCHLVYIILVISPHTLTCDYLSILGLNLIHVSCLQDVITHHWPLLLTWFNFNPSMDK